MFRQRMSNIGRKGECFIYKNPRPSTPVCVCAYVCMCEYVYTCEVRNGAGIKFVSRHCFFKFI